MFKRLRRGFFVAVVLLFMLCLGFATPALADGEPTYTPSEAKLTAVIVAPVGTDASKDTYVFHFAGGGTVEAGAQEESGKIPVYSGGVEQDYTTIKDKDVVPTIPDVTLSGRQLTSDNSLTNGDLGQTVVQMPLSGILNEVTFPHAGIYTYEVTETSATSDPSKAYVAASQAKYCLRIWVKNADTGGQSVLGTKRLAIDYVTVERKKDDAGNEVHLANNAADKVDPKYPTTDKDGKINKGLTTQQSEASGFVGDPASGRNVPGFTFANEYYTVGPFQVKKLYDGDHSDRTRYSTVELAVKSSASPDASGGALTYKIEGEGIDLTESNKVGDEHSKLNGVEGITQINDYMVQFDDKGWCYIKADLKEGSSIRITGEFGPLVNSKREVLSTNGLFRGQAYYVLENDPGDYRPTGYVYAGSDSYTNDNNEVVYIDPRKDYSDNNNLWYKQDHVGNSPIDNRQLPDGMTKDINAFALLIEGRNTTGNDTIFVVNSLDEAKVSPTGIFVDNLPYILMIGMPLVVFAGMFVARRRGYAA